MDRDKILEFAKSLNLPLGNYVVVGGGSLAVRNMRTTNDLDIVVIDPLFKELQQNGWPRDYDYEKRWNRQRLKKDGVEFHRDFLLTKENRFVDVADVISQADIIDGIPFQNLESLLMFKKDAEREKDAADVALIETYLKDL